MNHEEASNLETYFFQLSKEEQEKVLREYFATLRNNMHTGNDRYQKCAFAFNILRSCVQKFQHSF